MSYEIQAKGKNGDFDSEYISGDPKATTFDSREQAEQEIDNLRRENPAYTDDYKIVEK